MSMWEVEGLGEIAIELVAGTDSLEPAEKRTLYAGIFQLQNGYDCSYTHFRRGPDLLRDGFLHGIPLERHPAFEDHGDALTELARQKSAWLPLDPSEPGSPYAGIFTAGPASAEERLIYFDVTDPLWGIAVSRGDVPPLEPTPYEAMDDLTAALRVMHLAADRLETDPTHGLAQAVLKGFYGFTAMHCMWFLRTPEPESVELKRLMERPSLVEALRASTIDWVDERFAVPDYPKADESGAFDPAFVRFWRAPIAGA